MIVINSQTGGVQTQAIQDGAMSVQGVFDVATTNGEIKVLCFIANQGYYVVTWKDTGANTLTYVGQQKILDYSGVSTASSDSVLTVTACPVVSQ